jgi:hypothetical protein
MGVPTASVQLHQIMSLASWVPWVNSLQIRRPVNHIRRNTERPDTRCRNVLITAVLVSMTSSLCGLVGCERVSYKDRYGIDQSWHYDEWPDGGELDRERLPPPRP